MPNVSKQCLETFFWKDVVGVVGERKVGHQTIKEWSKSLGGITGKKGYLHVVITKQVWERVVRKTKP